MLIFLKKMTKKLEKIEKNDFLQYPVNGDGRLHLTPVTPLDVCFGDDSNDRMWSNSTQINHTDT